MIKKLLALGSMLALSLSAVAQSTTVIGTFKSGDGVTVVSSGQLTATLTPGIDTVASGVARFSATEVDCLLNGSNVGTNQAVRATNSVTISGLTGHTFIVGDTLQVAGMADSTFNGTFTITGITATSITYAQTAGNATSGSGTLSALRAISGSGACTVATNTLMQPSGTSWKFCVQPQFIQPGSCFVSYAIGGTMDLTSQPATPSLTPAYALVDTFSNQTINGNKTFLGTITFGGNPLKTFSLNNVLWVDGIHYTTIQAAIIDACLSAPVKPVYISPGIYTQNSTFTNLCNGLMLMGMGRCQVDAGTCPTTITTTMTAGKLFDLTNLSDMHIADFAIKSTAASPADSVFFMDGSQRNVVERIYIAGGTTGFSRGIVLHTSSTSTGSTIRNNFKDVFIASLSSAATGCLIDTSDATNKVVNSNKFDMVACQGGATGGFGFRCTNTNQAQNANENWFYGDEFATGGSGGTGTGVKIDAGCTKDMRFEQPNIESNGTGFNKAITNTVLITGGNISSNGNNSLAANITDAQPAFTIALGVAIGSATPNYSVDPSGNVRVNSLCLGGASCDAGNINLVSGQAIEASGTSVITPLNTAVELDKPAKLVEQAAPACSAGNDFLWGDSTDHILKTCQNNGSVQGVAPRIYELGCNGVATANTTLTVGWPGNATTACTNTATTLQLPATSKGIAKNLRVRCGTAGINASSGLFTLVDNGGNTTLACTIGTGTACSDTTHTPAIAAADLLLVQFTTQIGETLASCAVSFEVQ